MERQVVFAFDQNFERFTAVALFSVLVHATKPLLIHCIVDEGENVADDLVLAVGQRFNTEVRLHRVRSKQFAGWTLGHHCTPASYYRLLIPQLIPGERALYLDSDIVATCDIGPLLDIDLGSAWLAGQTDVIGAATSCLPRSPEEPYLNAGVLLINLVELRKVDLVGHCRAVHDQFIGRATYAEQCLLNYVCAGRKRIIDACWNIQTQQHGPFGLEASIGNLEGQAILHACGPTKPWMSWSDPWLARIWMSYARLVGPPAIHGLPQTANTLDQWWSYAHALEAEGRWREAAGVKEALLRHLTGQGPPACTP